MVMLLHFCQTGWRTRGPGLSRWCRWFVVSTRATSPAHASIDVQTFVAVVKVAPASTSHFSFLLLFLNTSIHERNRFCWCVRRVMPKTGSRPNFPTFRSSSGNNLRNCQIRKEFKTLDRTSVQNRTSASLAFFFQRLLKPDWLFLFKLKVTPAAVGIKWGYYFFSTSTQDWYHPHCTFKTRTWWQSLVQALEGA